MSLSHLRLDAFTRRAFLAGTALSAGSALLVACGGSPTATPIATLGSVTPSVPVPATAVRGTVAPSLPSTTMSTAVAASPSTARSPTGGTGPAASGVASTNGERELTFTSGGDTIFGTLRLPDGGQGKNSPAALILAGSGPTDRDGNNKLISGPVETLRNFADALAAQGIASLRYDKLGAGKTGLGTHTTSADIGFALFVDEARAAYALLRARPEVDPRRSIILGHSEGGLIALVLADQVKGSADQPEALVLAAPLGIRYLETIRQQLTDQYNRAQQAGQVTKDQAETALMELDLTIASLRETGKVPTYLTPPALKQVFTPTNERFLAEVDRYDPRQIAATLPPTLPVLVLRGTKDQQISSADMQNVMQGFQMAGNTKATLAELADVDHVFKEVPGAPNPATDYGNPALRFSVEAVTRLAAFTKANV
jgi:alpha-beta hydrolase superfamily lysophospholipase